MKKSECIDAIAYAGVPDGSRLVKFDVGKNITVTTVTRENAKQAAPLMMADMMRTTLQILLTDIPDDVEMTPEHFQSVENVLNEHYRLMMVNLLFPELQTATEAERRQKLEKLAQLKADATRTGT